MVQEPLEEPIAACPNWESPLKGWTKSNLDKLLSYFKQPARPGDNKMSDASSNKMVKEKPVEDNFNGIVIKQEEQNDDTSFDPELIDEQSDAINENFSPLRGEDGHFEIPETTAEIQEDINGHFEIPEDIKIENTAQSDTEDTAPDRFYCDICLKSFSSKGNLGTHLEKHAGIKYPCTKCTKTFAYHSVPLSSVFAKFYIQIKFPHSRSETREHGFHVRQVLAIVPSKTRPKSSLINTRRRHLFLYDVREIFLQQ
uniref:C2H2-type domain-containing protein n=1 Tax=Cacopsylla melanoneura TaxID=428564 RepID=A0A8D8RQK3_9HEMI